MVLPFGLAVDKPVTLTIDEGGSPIPLHFKTCVPVGCLVTLTLDPATVSSLRRGSVLNVKATAAETSQDTSFKVSLKGFGSAIDRTAALTK
jgi:invasion protein IalB